MAGMEDPPAAHGASHRAARPNVVDGAPTRHATGAG